MALKIHRSQLRLLAFRAEKHRSAPQGSISKLPLVAAYEDVGRRRPEVGMTKIVLLGYLEQTVVPGERGFEALAAGQKVLLGSTTNRLKATGRF